MSHAATERTRPLPHATANVSKEAAVAADAPRAGSTAEGPVRSGVPRNARCRADHTQGCGSAEWNCVGTAESPGEPDRAGVDPVETVSTSHRAAGAG